MSNSIKVEKCECKPVLDCLIREGLDQTCNRLSSKSFEISLAFDIQSINPRNNVSLENLLTLFILSNVILITSKSSWLGIENKFWSKVAITLTLLLTEIVNKNSSK